MRMDGTLVGTHWGPLSAIGRQPRRVHANDVRVHTPTEPWGSQKLPPTLAAGDPRRTLFRSLLRRAEGVPVAFADGSGGVVADVVLPALGFDFWAEELAVTVGDANGRVPVGRVRQIDVRPPPDPAGRARRRHRAPSWTAPGCSRFVRRSQGRDLAPIGLASFLGGRSLIPRWAARRPVR